MQDFHKIILISYFFLCKTDEVIFHGCFERALLFAAFVVQSGSFLPENKHFHLFLFEQCHRPTCVPPGPHRAWKNARKLLLEMSRIGNTFIPLSSRTPRRESFSFVCNHGLIAPGTVWESVTFHYRVCILWYHLWLYSHCEQIRKHSKIAIYSAGSQAFVFALVTSTNICELPPSGAKCAIYSFHLFAGALFSWLDVALLGIVTYGHVSLNKKRSCVHSLTLY